MLLLVGAEETVYSAVQCSAVVDECDGDQRHSISMSISILISVSISMFTRRTNGPAGVQCSTCVSTTWFLIHIKSVAISDGIDVESVGLRSMLQASAVSCD